MSFRLSIAKCGRATLAGLICLGFAAAAHAQEGTRSIEVVPFHNQSGDTNFDQVPQNDSPGFEVWKPSAPNAGAPASRVTRTGPLPQPQQPLSKQEQQLQERRRNWVFMTPEDYATTDTKTDKGLLGTDNDKEDNLSAMERYFHRLEQSSSSAATNQFNRMNADRLSVQTNSLSNVSRNDNLGTFAATPFNSAPNAGIFQPLNGDNSVSVFGKNDNNLSAPSPEEVRARAEHKTRMENYKQLWDIDQPSTAATSVSSPSSGPIDSAPLFGASSPGMSSFKPSSFGTGGGSGNGSSAQAPKPVATPRYSPPPHSDFAPVQRPF